MVSHLSRSLPWVRNSLGASTGGFSFLSRGFQSTWGQPTCPPSPTSHHTPAQHPASASDPSPPVGLPGPAHLCPPSTLFSESPGQLHPALSPPSPSCVSCGSHPLWAPVSAAAGSSKPGHLGPVCEEGREQIQNRPGNTQDPFKHIHALKNRWASLLTSENSTPRPSALCFLLETLC